ncbi:hypothetical protein QC762_0019550 [Podospora pseudocomata]|uniref:Uncharacterized protein n=1 Tax=Podospora pseudocomata TaxID=2093779 RepID=A0ABR0GXF8_9PEZI|nr:hypothetical protein QC762_0019550 [Podospora pseudocomata]
MYWQNLNYPSPLFFCSEDFENVTHSISQGIPDLGKPQPTTPIQSVQSSLSTVPENLSDQKVLPKVHLFGS